MDGAEYRDLLRPLFEGRRVILAGGVAVSWTATVRQVRDLGATDVLVIGTEGMGAGPLPDPAEATVVALPAPATTSVMEAIHSGLQRMRSPTIEVLDAVRSFDPRREALVLGHFLGAAPELDDRPVLAYRRPEWVALEDKTRVDELWDRIDIERAPSVVVPAKRPALMDAAGWVGSDTGSVWSGDAREGFNGGGEFVRWVRTTAEAEQAVRFFTAHCHRVRVMPFLDGVPCSIHGIVFPDHVAAVRPVEMVTLRQGQGMGQGMDGGFFYAGCASFYDPPVRTRERMRSIAHRVGAALRTDVDFRGAFTVDGVVVGDRFLPTELNPRLGAGLSVIARGLPDLPIQLLMDALVGGIDLEYDEVDFEADLLAGADAHRSGGTWRAVPSDVAESYADVPLSFADGSWRWAENGAPAAAKLTTGPAALGTFLHCTFAPDATPVGPSVGSRAAAFWDFADRELGTAVGPLAAATLDGTDSGPPPRRDA
jgi:hypothetical protein